MIPQKHPPNCPRCGKPLDEIYARTTHATVETTFRWGNVEPFAIRGYTSEVTNIEDNGNDYSCAACGATLPEELYP